jgi:hypothetical protein
MQLLVSLVVTLSISRCLTPGGGWQMVVIQANNAWHMTVERATTPRVARRFRVLDAETREPVAGARLVVVHNFDWMDDWEMNGTTDAAGVATFQLARDYLHLLHAHVGAEGYLTRTHLMFGANGGDGDGEGVHTPGVGRLSDDPVDVFIYKGPAPTTGYRVPAGYRGRVEVRPGPAKSEFPFPPDFPKGQRVWWTDLKPGATTLVEQPPPLGFDPGGAPDPIQVIDSNGRPIPMPDPGAEFEGVAYWRIGTLEPNGPWDVTQPVALIGDRAQALALAKQVWERHGNGRTGYILNGWLKILSPETKLADEHHPDGVTRVGGRQ